MIRVVAGKLLHMQRFPGPPGREWTMNHLRGVRPAELRDLYRTLQRQGAVLSFTGSTHIHILLPNGRALTGPSSSSRRNAARALSATLRKYADWDVESGTSVSDPDGRVKS